jgi:hypothetical protein
MIYEDFLRCKVTLGALKGASKLNVLLFIIIYNQTENKASLRPMQSLVSFPGSVPCTARSSAITYKDCWTSDDACKKNIYSHAITFYFQLQHSTSQTLISLLPTHNMPQVRVTRSVSMALHPVPAFNSGYGQRSFIHTFTKVWNGIPNHIRVLQSITQFKKSI